MASVPYRQNPAKYAEETKSTQTEPTVETERKRGLGFVQWREPIEVAKVYRPKAQTKR